MKKSLWCSLLSVFLFLAASCMAAYAQEGLNGETEFGTNGKGREFFSQFLNYDGARWGLLTRYFKVEDVLERGEFALGPKAATGALKVDLRFGYCTDHEIMTNAILTLALSKTANAQYVFEGKFSTTDKIPTTIYQKFFLPLTSKGTFLFRIENLWVDRKLDFFRIGAEFDYNFPGNNSHFFLAPFYDKVNGKIAVQSGFRFL